MDPQMPSLPKALCAAALTAAVLIGAQASAATITVSNYARGNLAGYQADLAAFDAVRRYVYEDFEGLGPARREGETIDGFATGVGTFRTLGGKGTGGTVRGLPGNTGTELALRDGGVYGRRNTSPNGAWFLDSNDTWGMSWEVDIGSMFSRVAFALTDGSDTGAYLRLRAAGETWQQRVQRRPGNGNLHWFQIGLAAPTSSLLIEIGNFASNALNAPYVVNDGFGMDDIRIAPVPLPASALLLLGAFGGLALVRRSAG